MKNEKPRKSFRDREASLLTRMIDHYCSTSHNTAGNELCESCRELLEYAHRRLENCRYGDAKPTCRKCPVHCYKPEKRDQIRKVMRISGQALCMRGDMDALRHMFRGFWGCSIRKKPSKTNASNE